MRKLLPFVAALFCASATFAQTFPAWECGSDSARQAAQSGTPDYQLIRQQMQQQIRNYINNLNNLQPLTLPINQPATYVIPVVVHVVHNQNDAVGQGTNITYTQIESQIDALNAAFAATYPSYNNQLHNFLAVNTEIQFCLARTPLSGTTPWIPAEPGVVRYPVDILTQQGQDVYDIQNNQTSAQSLYNLTHAPNPNAFPFANYLNVWLVHTIGGNVVIGYGTFPVLNTYAIDGVVMRADVFGDNTTGNTFPLMSQLNQGKIFAHEVGHWLNLLHTHEGGSCVGTLDPNTSDPCDLLGDEVCDTPPTQTVSFNCIGSPSSNCFENCGALAPYYTFLSIANNAPDLFEDYMSYSDDNCMNTFTNGQMQRMWATLQLFRANVSTPVNWGLTGIAGPGACIPLQLVADITFSPNQICANQPVTFSTTTGQGFSAILWDWDFGDGNQMLATINSAPVHTYMVSGTYTVTLTAYDGNSNSVTNTLQVFVAPCAPITDMENANWYFGQYAEISFLTGTPVQQFNARNNLTIFDTEAAVTLNDPATGALIYYTNGIDIWNNQHQQFNLIPLGGHMANASNTVIGNDLTNSVAQILALPFPNHPNQSFVFIPSAAEDFYLNGLRFALIDMSGTGTVLQQGQIPLPPGVLISEYINAIPHCNGRDYWIITHGVGANNTRFYVYLLSPAGITNGTMTLSTPDMYGPFSAVLTGTGGTIKCSPDGTRLVWTDYSETTLNLYQFNSSTGLISNEQQLSYLNHAYLSCSFSPNSQFLYGGTWNPSSNIIQYDLTNSNLVSAVISLPAADVPVDMQIGPDNRIYVELRWAASTFIASIDNPNVVGSTVFTTNAVNFTNTVLSIFKLPNVVDAIQPAPSTPTFTAVVQPNCSTFVFTADPCWGNYTANWDFGDNTTGTGSPVTHTYLTSGTYTVTLTLSTPQETLTPVTLVISVITGPLAVNGPTLVCSGNIFPAQYCASPALTGNNIVYNWTVSGGGQISGPSNQPCVDIIWTSNGTLTLTVGNTACSFTTTVTVNVVPGVTVSAGPDYILCLGGAAILGGTASGGTTPYTIIWTPPTGLSSSTILTPVATPTVTTSYTLTVTDANGCSASDDATVTIDNSQTAPAVTLTSPFTQSCTFDPAYNLTGSPAGGTFSGTGITNTVNGTFNPLTAGAGTHTITYTYIDPNTGCGNLATFTIIVISNCCSNCTQYMPAVISTNTTYSTGSVCVNNNVSITSGATLTISGIHARMLGINGTGVRINVAAGCTLRVINNARMYSCNSDLWDGIYVQPGGYVEVLSGSMIEDAMNAIVSVNGGKYLCDNAFFNKNYKSIKVLLYAGVHPGIIRSTMFNAITTPLTSGPQTTLKAPFTGKKPHVGVEITDVTDITVGVTSNAQINQFWNLEIGIHVLQNTKLTATNNHFRNLFYSTGCPPNLTCPNTGIGILIENNSNLIAGGASTLTNRFRNSTHGIVALNNVDANIGFNDFNGITSPWFITSRCISFINHVGRSITIKNNDLFDFEHGIVVQNTTDCFTGIKLNALQKFGSGIGIYGVQVKKNSVLNSILEIHGNSFNNNGNTTGLTAIRVQNAIQGVNCEVDIETNIIRNCKTGILCSRLTGARIENQNDVRFQYSAPPSSADYGIRITDCPKTLIDNNLVWKLGNANLSAAYANLVNGIAVDLSCTGTQTSNNNVIRLANGIRFSGSGNLTQIVNCNFMTNNRIGMQLNSTAIGDQGSSTSQAPPFGIAQDNQWGIPSGMLGAGGSGVFITPNFYTRSNTLPWFPSQLLQMVPLGTIQTSPPFSVPSAPYTCIYGCPNPPCLQQKIAQLARRQAPFDTQLLDATDTYITSQGAYNELMLDSTLVQLNTPDDSIVRSFRDSLMFTNIGLLYHVNDYATAGDTINARLMNQAFTPVNTPEQNHKIVNEIYIRTWARAIWEFSPQDSATLLYVADQNADQGGLAVIQARVMLMYDVDDYGGTPGRSNEADEPELLTDGEGQVFPNPADKQITYVLNTPLETDATLLLYDLLGQVVATKFLPAGTIETSINTAELTPGLYLYRLQAGDLPKRTGRIVITH